MVIVCMHTRTVHVPFCRFKSLLSVPSTRNDRPLFIFWYLPLEFCALSLVFSSKTFRRRSRWNHRWMRLTVGLSELPFGSGPLSRLQLSRCIHSDKIRNACFALEHLNGAVLQKPIISYSVMLSDYVFRGVKRKFIKNSNLLSVINVLLFCIRE